jgi:hypothetical protein
MSTWSDQIAATGASSSGTSSSSAAEPTVFLGTSTHGGGGFHLDDGGKVANKSSTTLNTMSMSEAKLEWYKWTPAQQLALAKKLYALGYLQNPTDIFGARDQYFNAMGDSANYFSAGRHITPMQVLDMGAGVNADTLKKRGQVNPDGSITRTNSSIDLSDRGSVEALATQVLQQALGRDPTPSEVNTYYNTIRGQEQSHPTRQTVTTDANGNVSQTSSGGFGQDDAQMLLKQQVQNDPEFAKYQGGTTYYGAALQALGAVAGA